MKLSVVIPVYKKTDMFLKNLSSNIRMLPKDTEIIIVDDASREELEEKLSQYIKKNEVILLTNYTNQGFAKTINRGIKEAKGNYILLLGSDVLLQKKFSLSFESLFLHDESIAAISFGEKGDDNIILGKSRIFFKRGLVMHSRAKDIKHGETAWANGGSCIFRADYLKKLNGFGTLYSPFYWEDIDLSYRAYAMGWRIMFDPSYIVDHKRESTITNFFSPSYIRQIAYRNQFYFIWSNITDIRMTLLHMFWLPINLFLMSIKGETGFVVGFFTALPKICAIIKRRFVKRRYQKVSDQQIFAKFHYEK